MASFVPGPLPYKNSILLEREKPLDLVDAFMHEGDNNAQAAQSGAPTTSTLNFKAACNQAFQQAQRQFASETSIVNLYNAGRGSKSMFDFSNVDGDKTAWHHMGEDDFSYDTRGGTATDNADVPWAWRKAGWRRKAEDDVWKYLDFRAAESGGGWESKALVATDRVARELIYEKIKSGREDTYIRYEQDGSDGPTLTQSSDELGRERIAMSAKWLCHYGEVCPIEPDGSLRRSERYAVPFPTTRQVKNAEAGDRESWRTAVTAGRLLADLLPSGRDLWRRLTCLDLAADSGGASLPAAHYVEELVFSMLMQEEEEEEGGGACPAAWFEERNRATGPVVLFGCCLQHPNNTAAHHSAREVGWVGGLPVDLFVNRLRKDSAAILANRLHLNKAIAEKPEEWGFVRGVCGRDPDAVVKIYGPRAKIVKAVGQIDAGASLEESIRPVFAGMRQASLTRWGLVGNQARQIVGAEIAGYASYTATNPALQYEPGKWLAPAPAPYRGMLRSVGACLIPSDHLTVQVNTNDALGTSEMLDLVQESSAKVCKDYIFDRFRWRMETEHEPEKWRSAAAFGLLSYNLELEVRYKEKDQMVEFQNAFDEAFAAGREAAEDFMEKWVASSPPERVKTQPTGLRSLWALCRRKTPTAAVALVLKVKKILGDRWVSTKRVESRHAVAKRCASSSNRRRGIEVVGAMLSGSVLTGTLKAALARVAKIERAEWVLS
eukprot:g15255.t1